MPLEIASRRLKAETLAARFGPEAEILDVTSQGPEPWVRFSPFFPHGGIPVPGMPGVTSESVEGLWQALKVFERAGVDPSKLRNRTMRGLKRSARSFGRVLGHEVGDRRLSYLEARRALYLPSYRFVLENRLASEVEALRDLSRGRLVVLLDYETNGDVEDLAKPLSHAALVKAHVEGTWPEERSLGYTECGPDSVPR